MMQAPRSKRLFTRLSSMLSCQPMKSARFKKPWHSHSWITLGYFQFASIEQEFFTSHLVKMPASWFSLITCRIFTFSSSWCTKWNFISMCVYWRKNRLKKNKTVDNALNNPSISEICRRKRRRRRILELKGRY